MVKFCTNCGNRLEDDDKFCTNCGQKVGDNRKEKEELQKWIEENKKRLEERERKRVRSIPKNKQNYSKESLEVNVFEANKLKYVEKKVKDSYHNIELASFEKKYIKNIKLKGSIEERNLQLKSIIKKIISNHEKVEPYDFACSLLEDGGFENRGQFTNHKRLAKKRDLETYVFIKLMDNRIETFASKVYPQIKLLSPTTIQSGDRAIFFNEISNIVFEKNQITLNLQNQDKLRFVSGDYSEIGKEKEQKFRELLNEKWMNYKENHEEKRSSSPQESNNNIGEDILKYAELYEKGLLTEEEFTALKKKLLGL